MIYGVIMAGGKGERFWPLSSENRPKQLLPITSERSMLQVTIDRVADYIPIEQTLIVAGANIKQAIFDSGTHITEENILAEPFGRNTCLAIGVAAVHLDKKDPEAIMVVLSADHLIEPASKLVDVIKAGTKVAAEQDSLITIGIVPTRAETGYGYIELGDQIKEVDGITVCKVSAFKEKPRPTVAQRYYHGRRHHWNSGMFIWSAKSLLSALKKHQPEMHELLAEYKKHIGTDGEEQALLKLYEEADPISIDYAVLEEADNVLTLKGDFIWDDVGSWMALQRFLDTDRENNVVVGTAVTLDSYESTVYNDGNGLIATLGISDLVIAKIGEVVMVAHKTQLGRIKELLTKIGDNEDLKKYL
ncbi:MAG: mannose-1-phosphate guanylyltransferase [FCB group bacterium]|nr:mannose-1-phosphate guanylyltransferase [FCB group bacterium]